MVLLYVLGIVVVLNCVYFLLFSRFSFSKTSEPISSEKHSISLIVCAKNETENLKNNIPLWLAQDYPNFEIILINDASSDDTLDVMEQFASENDCIQIVNVKNNEAFWGNKKYALTLGIKRAKNKHMLFTDADCKPASNQWLATMAGSFTEEKELVLGYGAYEKRPGFLNSLIRYETLLTAVQYFSYAKAGTPYMGVGRNLAYTSSLYYANNGFMSHIKIPSGDDDLFVNEAATSKNTALCYSENAFTYSLPKKTWKAWITQKKRHVSTAKLYKPTHKLLLGAYYLLNVLFWLTAALSFIFIDWKIPTLLISFRFIIQWITIGKAASKLKENNLIPIIPFLDLFLVFIQMSIFISNSASKQTKWN